MRWLLNVIGNILDFFTVTLWGTLLDFFEWVKQLVTETLPNIVFAMLPDGAAEYLQDIDLQALYNITEPITWWIPIWTLITIYLAAYGLAGGIRLVRFIIGWIPTIEG